MKSRVSRGFTLVELIIAIAVLGLIAVLVGSWLTKCSSSRDEAEEEARSYAQKMGMEIKGVSCMNLDTDDNGYVSCTLNVIEKDGKTSPVPIECASKWSFNNDGCREALVNGFRRGR